MGAAVGSVSSPDDGSRKGLWPPLDHRDRVGSERHFHHHSVTATVVMQHPNVDGGVLGARGVNFQMPLPPSILAQSRHAGCPGTDQAGRPQETEQTGSSCGTFVAHKGERPWSAGSASVKQPSTKRRIVSVPCGIRSHS